MNQLSVSRRIDAPVERVFDTVADIGNYSKAIPDIVRAEIISEVKAGVGTRYRETRLMGGHEITTELEVTEFVENDHVRIVTDTHGTVWDSRFCVESTDGYTALTLTIEGRPHTLAAKITSTMAMAMIRTALEKDMDAVKAFCEASISG
jgi:hypothetical protein